MRVYGYELTKEQINKAIEFMQKATGFSTLVIEKVLIQEGVPINDDRLYIASRAADRIVQQQRKAGNIRLVSKSLWRWNKKPGGTK